MAELGYDYDLFVIGSGSGGVRAARIAAQAGAKVAIAEEYRVGGTCVIRGCVPKKFMVYASDYGRKLKEAQDYGWQVESSGFDFPKFMSNMHAEVDRLSGIYLRNLANAGVDVFEERAEMQDAHTIVLKDSGKTFSVDKILIATGGTPWRPTPEDLPGVEHTITSNEVFHIEELPKHIVIAGGGYIACEFAHIFAGLGVDTCLVYRGDTVLNGFDWDVRTSVHEGLKEAGVRVITSAVLDEVTTLEGEDHPYCVHLSNDTKIKSDVVLMAVGRRPATAGLGCDKAGVELDEKGAVIVDDMSRTNVPNVFAVGDVTDRIQLTPVAIREGHAFADTVFGGEEHSFDHDNVASAVFTQPEVGTVGMTEAEARKAFGEVDIYKTRFRPMQTALLEHGERVMIKLVVKADDERVVGVHIVSPDAAEMIQMLGIAVKMGVTKSQFDATCAVHPTIAEEIVTLRHKWVPETEPA
ncbi:glutathione-disulfide reductase [Henriciella aquimarina]|uniref:glutathione-disulfide reductase n=1 Tax=Henriciella aquimarina TaxID=545261 RepID=UPI0009FD80A0|nr:glutathione-disulfide reductase [Henriciella aquimarina]